MQPQPTPVRIHAMMITGKCPERRSMAKVAAECFLRQTHPNRRLLIVNHGEEPLAIKTRMNEGDHYVGCDEVLVTRVECPTLGDLRNRALDLCMGGCVCVWDDDDWMADDYMATLLRIWRPGHLVLMRKQIRHDLERDTSYVATNLNGHYGQALYGADVEHRYPARDRHEDAEFSHGFGERRILLDNDPGVYVRTFHGNNTWGRKHVMGRLSNRSDVHFLEKDHLALVREVRKLYGFRL